MAAHDAAKTRCKRDHDLLIPANVRVSISTRTGNPYRVCLVCAALRKLQGKFGMLPEFFEEMYEAQGGKCAICSMSIVLGSSGDLRRQTACADHDHQTGLPRAFLCGNCNLAIGMLRDDPNLVASALAYLLQHQPAEALI